MYIPLVLLPVNEYFVILKNLEFEVSRSILYLNLLWQSFQPLSDNKNFPWQRSIYLVKGLKNLDTLLKE